MLETTEVKSKNLSLGNAQRLGIAKAIIHKPKILLLDEPTNGLDPAGIVEIRKLLSDLAQNLGVTMIISSHKLEEIAKLATNIAIIHHGQLVKNIKAQDLENQLHKSLLVDGKNPKRISNILKGAGYKINQLKKDNKNTPLEILDREAIKNPERIATILVNSGEPPIFLKVQKEDLETYFIRTITKSEGEDL